MGILLSGAADAVTDAEAITGVSPAGAIGSYILIWGAVIAVFWFFMLRPQSKEKKRLTAMLSTLEVGDSVQTTSGFFGVVIDIVDNTVIVEFGNNKNCRIPMDKAAISKVEKPGDN